MVSYSEVEVNNKLFGEGGGRMGGSINPECSKNWS